MRTPKAMPRVACWLTVICAMPAMAGSPMGPPMATLEEGQWALGGQYGYSKTDLKGHGAYLVIPDRAASTYGYERLDIDGLASHMIFASLAYGIVDNWDVFLRLGATDARGDVSVRTADASDPLERLAYGGGHGFACGGGTRATVCRWGPWTIGGLAQVTWLNPGSDGFVSRDLRGSLSTSAGCFNIEAWQAQVALAAAYQIDTFRFWAGPFLEFTEGSYERDGQALLGGIPTGRFTSSGDIEETSRVGLHCGATWEASPQLHYQLEGQFAADAWMLGVSVVLTPRWLATGI